MNVTISMRYFIMSCIVLSIGCQSIQREKYISATKNPESPHAILRVAIERSLVNPQTPPVVVSINDEIPEPRSFSALLKDEFVGADIIDYRIPVGACRVKALVPKYSCGYLGAKERENAAIYNFSSEAGKIYRVIGSLQRGMIRHTFVHIIEDRTGRVVAPISPAEDAAKLIIMLNSGNYEEIRGGLSQTQNGVLPSSIELQDAFRNAISNYIKHPSENDIAIDAMAWVCISIGSANMKENAVDLEKLLNSSVSPKIKKHAKNSLNQLGR